jgi:hypothetical protein
MTLSSLPSPKSMLRDHLAFAGLSTVGLLITVLAIAIGYDIYADGPVSQSFWNEAISGIVPWYAAGIGVYLMVVTFPQYILYGDTRKRFAQRIALFSVPFCAALALLILAALWVERLVYRVAGWNHAISNDHLYGSATDVPAIVLEFFVILLPWFAFGALLGATYIGRQELFFIALPAAIAGVAIVNILLGLDDGPSTLVNRWVEREDENTALGVISSLVISSAALYGVRLITRTVPIKTQAA